MAERIGFVGVGRMGANMARRLKESGYEIGAVYDVNTAAAQLSVDLIPRRSVGCTCDPGRTIFPAIRLIIFRSP